MVYSGSMFDGKVAVVTGGGRGIGRAMALAFARCGADVAVASRTVSDLEEVVEEVRALGRRSLPVQTDITVRADVDNMASKIKEEVGTIDILVNNAATNVMRKLLDLREDKWDQIIDTDLKGYWLCSQAVGKIMVERGRGCIINISSTAAQKAANGMGAYCIAKAGVVMLTRALALELASSNIRVNTIAPSIVRTEFSKPIWSNPEMLSKVAPDIPLGRIAEPEDVAEMALFLASDTSSYLTGQTVYLDGGISA